jgi:hypothetical protein
VALATLDPPSAEAWEIYGRLGSRFAVDFGLVPDVLRRLVAEWSDDDVLDLVDRLAVMYDTFSPPRQD